MNQAPWVAREWRWAAGLAILLALAAGGCVNRVRSADDEEMRNPLVQSAIEHERKGDADGAMRLYRDALNRNPSLARAHLGLAFLLDAPGRDYVLAIYHYNLYLDLRPKSEKRAMILDRIRLARIAFAATLIQESGTTLGAELTAAKQENAGLKIANQNLKAQLQQLHLALGQRQGPAAGRPAGTAPVSGRGAARARVYHVEPGDNLMRIATKVYGDGKRWKDILNANRPALQKADDLRMGQTLKIP